MIIQIILINNTRRMLKARGLTLVCHRVAQSNNEKIDSSKRTKEERSTPFSIAVYLHLRPLLLRTTAYIVGCLAKKLQKC